MNLTKPLITVKEARKILGRDSNGLSDTQVEEIIVTVSLIAKHYLRTQGSNK